MVSPTVVTAKKRSNNVSSDLEPDCKTISKKFFIYYAIVIFILMIVCKPSFVTLSITSDILVEKQEKIVSYSKLLLWELILCLPFILYYIINN